VDEVDDKDEDEDVDQGDDEDDDEDDLVGTKKRARLTPKETASVSKPVR
jgi:hypothetical protein